jgi:hypothetical protein
MEQTGEVNPFLLVPRGSEPLFFGQQGEVNPFSSEGEVNPYPVGSEGKWTPLRWAVRGSEPLH